MAELTEVAVIGGGSWGTALAMLANRAGSKTILWSRNASVIQGIRERRVNRAYLPGVFIDPDIHATDDMEEVRKSDFLVLAVPAQKLRAMAIHLSDRVDEETPLVIACKGIEKGSLALMHEIIGDVLPRNPLLVLSGPNFAMEVAKGMPAATTVACKKESLANRFIYAIGGRLFRPYYTSDLITTEVAGAVKNVIAIACGIAVGCGYGENARAALITRGLAEIMRLAVAKGGRRDSLLGLAGVGDLTLTCTSAQSRNYRFGEYLGQQQKIIPDQNRSKFGLVEGAATAESVTRLSHKLNVSMPLCQTVNSILQQESGLEEAIQQLMDRPFVMDVEQTSL